MIEYTIVTAQDRFITEDELDAQEYWEDLSKEDKEGAEYFQKTWKLSGGEWIEIECKNLKD